MSENRRDAQNQPVPFTCQNAAFKTDTSRGHPHGDGQAAGSVFAGPLANSDGFTLFLEHVTVADDSAGGVGYWLMWYEPDGTPLLKHSALLDERDLRYMRDQFATLPISEENEPE
jgi:hypothetical protein